MNGKAYYDYDPTADAGQYNISAKTYPCKIKIQEVTTLKYHKIDKEFLPDLPKHIQSNWNANDKDNDGYVDESTTFDVNGDGKVNLFDYMVVKTACLK